MNVYGYFNDVRKCVSLDTMLFRLLVSSYAESSDTNASLADDQARAWLRDVIDYGIYTSSGVRAAIYTRICKRGLISTYERLYVDDQHDMFSDVEIQALQTIRPQPNPRGS